MAAKVAASAMGGGSFLTRAVGSLVSKQISWDNKVLLESLLKSVQRKCSTSHELERYLPNTTRKRESTAKLQ